MLIRTQDKRSLVDMSGMTIRVCTEDSNIPGRYVIVAYSNYTTGYVREMLGIYSSSEKTMKVLDIIQDAYLSPIVRNVVNDNEVEIYQNKVFEMPADSEVNV